MATDKKILVNVPPDQREQKLLEAVGLLRKLRMSNDEWYQQYGYKSREARKSLDARADKWLEEILIKPERDDQ
jgi:hypothetical protein